MNNASQAVLEATMKAAVPTSSGRAHCGRPNNLAADLTDIKLAIESLPCVNSPTVPLLQVAYEAGHSQALRQAGEFVGAYLASHSCDECAGTGKCGPDDNPNEMDCEVCNGRGTSLATVSGRQSVAAPPQHPESLTMTQLDIVIDAINAVMLKNNDLAYEKLYGMLKSAWACEATAPP